MLPPAESILIQFYKFVIKGNRSSISFLRDLLSLGLRLEIAGGEKTARQEKENGWKRGNDEWKIGSYGLFLAESSARC